MSFIEVQNLTKVYSHDFLETPALCGVSFSIIEGEFVAIMGPSGSGKSTLVHILGLLDRHSAGTYQFMGKSIEDFPDAELAHIRNETMGFVFQAFFLLSRTSVLHNVMLPLLYSDIPEKEWKGRAEDAIASVGLTHRINHEPSQLSGGEKQRVAIARSLVMNPRILFADEPTGNLDSVSGRQVMEIFQRLHREGNHTIILITHDLAIAGYARRTIRMKDGIIESDTY